MLDSPELLLEAYRDVAAISAVLGGLAFAAAVALLTAGATTDDPRTLRRPASITAGAAIASAVLLVFAALTWALLSANGAAALAEGGALDARTMTLNRVASLAFIAGVLFFFASIAASGWVASPALGVVTSTLASIAALGSLVVILQFVN